MRYLVPLCFVTTLLFIAASPGIAAEYDPLDQSDAVTVEPIYLDVTDTSRDRVIPLKVYLTTSKSPEPVVLFSHGLGGDREGGSYLGKHWSARGFVVVAIQHPGSDSSVWKDERVGQRQAAMSAAATPQKFIDRTEDVKVVLDQLAKWNHEAGHELQGRLDLDHIGMSGHSFGAMTTQAVSGQKAGRFGKSRTDARIKAAIAMSPSTPQRGSVVTAFGSVKIPWLLMTGTKDVSKFGDQTIDSRRAVYPALPPGDKYELVLHDAEHSAFGDRGLRGDAHPRDPNHHRVILAVSTAFWDAYLRHDSAAKAWLRGPDAKAVLGPQDQLQTK